MNRSESIEELIVAAHALTRIAAHETGNDAPAAQWRVLSLLRHDGPLRVGELAAASRVTQPGMTRLVTRLTENGLVERTGDPADSRATVVSITDQGADALTQWRTQLGQTVSARLADIDESDWTAIARVAELLAARTAVPVGAAR
ncbi:MarR family winged helix-turn-helix transcriptional regulator [Microbacterium terricola]|uniref:MarR family transcriptional regulator n=1 Tax=Microbacterium terricola TaxID=344163 RepID=A0ABM8DZG2_9MICO|nr:MarR family transcriptional regulator [Microbacterium terricola]UYK41292.1 MarR family transcriptional regulator [Microbacterium terricola]BDV30926.1 MarR family transcriptional regulator [Microbacterium terricola]